MSSRDLRYQARRALSGRWGVAILAGFLASILGGLATASSGGISIELDAEHLKLFRQLPESAIYGLLAILGGVATLNLAQFIMGGPVQLGYSQFLLKMHRGEDAQVKDLFSQFYRFAEGFCLYLLRGIFIVLWSMLFVIPGIVKSYSYAMAHFIMAEDPSISCVDAITRSRQLMDGHKAELFVLRLSFIGWHFLCILTCGIGYLWLIPYQNAAEAAFYHNLTDPTPVKPKEDDYDFSWMDQKEYL